MTKREYKQLRRKRIQMCRIRVNRWTQNIMVVLLCMTFFICEYFEINGYMTAAISVVLWIKGPSRLYYILESLHKLRHNWCNYM